MRLLPVAAAGDDTAGDGEDRTWGPIGALSGFAERLGGAVSETIGIDTDDGAGTNGDRPARPATAARPDGEDRP